MRKRQSEDTLLTVAVVTALAVLALTLWAGGRRLYSRWALGAQTAPSTAPRPEPKDDGRDHPPSVIPPLAMVGISATSRPPRPRVKTPASRPLPPITPDRE